MLQHHSLLRCRCCRRAGHPDGRLAHRRNASVTFAHVVENVKKAKSVSFVCKSKLGDRPEIECKMYLQGDMARYELPGVLIVVVDTNQRKGLELHTAPKVANRVDLVGQVPAEQLKDAIEQLRNMRRANQENVE